jgi:hypothetical protein
VLDLLYSQFRAQNSMPKRKKYKKPKEKILGDLKKENSSVPNRNPEENNLAEQIKKAATGLYYISETDAEILSFAGKQAETVTKEEVLSQTGSANGSAIEERDFTEFFARLTEIQDWFGDEEKETAQKFARLRELLEKNLRDLKVFKSEKFNWMFMSSGLTLKAS